MRPMRRGWLVLVLAANALTSAGCASASLYRDTFVRPPGGAGRYAPSHEPTEPGGRNTYVSGRSLTDPMLAKVVQYSLAAPFALAWDLVTAPVQVAFGYAP